MAALTIPVAVSNHRATQLESQFKKGVSNLNNALRMMQYNEPHWQVNLDDWKNAEGNQNGNDAAKRIGVLLKNCFVGAEGYVGERTSRRSFDKYYKNYQNTLAGDNYLGVFGYFDTADGMTVFPECSGDCNPMQIFIDINGTNRKPNRQGHDLFAFEIDKETGMLIPATRWGKNCNNTSKNSGFDCTQQAMSQKDYFKNLPK